jgi:hypothetical protein
LLGLLGLLVCAAGWLGSAEAGTLDKTSPLKKGSDLSVVRPVQSCEALSGVDLVAIGGLGSRVTSASETTRQGVRQCEVKGTLAPAIGFKVTLPVATWQQRYLQIGCGGLCGRIPEQVGAADGCVPLNSGAFATAATDMGHQGMDAEFGRDPQKRIDFAYRGVHLTAVAAKQLIAVYYGQRPAYAYFSGCSDGGREALMEAQRYPQDFDGVMAGAAAMSFQAQNSMYHAWQARSNSGPDGQAILLGHRLPLLHKAVLAACDGLDGQVDGLISDPRACRFNPDVLRCPDGAARSDATCLSGDEVATVKKLYAGPTDPVTGERLTMGGPQYGSELAWEGVFVPAKQGGFALSGVVSTQAIGSVVFEANPPADFKLADFSFDRATFDRLRPLHALYDATNPDLRAFEQRGGKLILWHGWADPHISPLNTIAYHEAVRGFMGAKVTQGFERLYLLPGVYHCSGGEGPSALDLLTPMMAWVEHGHAPNAITATTGAETAFGQPGGMAAGDLPMGAKPPGAPASQGEPRRQAHAARQQSMPVYPYPAVARFKGQGDPNSASSFKAGPPLWTGATPRWAGEAFFTADSFK